MNQNIKFSIIIPMYNAERYIVECISSITTQDYKNYEIIIVDDGSTDTSLAIVEKVISSNPMHLKLFHQKNSGPNVARNLAISKSSGDYLLFLDADDKFNCKALNLLSDKINEHKPDFINFGYSFFDNENNNIIKSSNFKTQSLFNEDIVKDVFLGTNITGVCWNKCIKRELVLANQLSFYPDKVHGRDILFSRQCCVNSKHVLILNDHLVYSRFHQGSFSRSFSKRNIESALDLSIKCKEIFDGVVDERYINHSISRHFRYILILSAFRTNSYKEFLEHYDLLCSSPNGHLLFTNIFEFRTLKTMITGLAVKLPRLLKFFASTLKKFNYEPY